MKGSGRPKKRENRAGGKPGERMFNAAPGASARDKRPGAPRVKREREAAPEPRPIDPVPWEQPGELAAPPKKKMRGAASRAVGRGEAAARSDRGEQSAVGQPRAARPSAKSGAAERTERREPRPARGGGARASGGRGEGGRAERPRVREERGESGSKAPLVRTGDGRSVVTVKLARGKSKPFWIGHPWVFSGAIASVEGEVGPFGAPCIVEDERDNALGFGHYNPDGAIAVRLLSHRRTTDVPFERPDVGRLVAQRLDEAIALRTALGFPSADTDVYRLVNAEGDFLPGLVVDRLGDVTSIQIGSRQMYDLRDDIVKLLGLRLETARTVVTVTETASKLEGLPMMSDILPELETQRRERVEVEVRESGIRYRIDLEHLQKTGFYADQRENRRRFAALCGGRSVLDAYCHVGGFGLSAARAGASRVVSVDSSNVAIDGARAAAGLNGLTANTEALVADAIVYLKEVQAAGRTFDRIVVDPPKFAQGRSHLEDALQKYARLNTLALSALGPGGLLLTCSCSRHVGEDEFGRMLTEAGHRLRKSVRVLERWGQPADHPTLSVAPEGRYLKCWLVSVGD